MLTKEQLKLEVDGLVEQIYQFVIEAGAQGVVIGNSGGKDSAVVIGLCAKALGKEAVETVAMPCESKSNDETLAYLVADTFGVSCHTVDLTDTYHTLKQEIESKIGITLSEEGRIGLKPRLRMTTLRGIAQTKNYMVLGTGNACEIFVGYFTKDGDDACDYMPLAEFVVEEVYQIARYIGVPETVLQEAPSDGISGLTDEQKLKVTYEQITKVIRNEPVEAKAKDRILLLHQKTEHKRVPRPIYCRVTK